MNKILMLLIIALVLTNCNSAINKSKKTTSLVDTSPKATGIGGIFFYSDNPKETKAWYVKNLGLEINTWGSSSFETRNVNNPDEINSTQWRPFKKGDAYFSPSQKDFMINYQVQNMDALVIKLKENGVTLLDSVANYDYGKFLHIMDSEGNKIELWEPISSDKNSTKPSK